MFITDDIKYIGVNDHNIDLFEGQYIVPNGMAYNSYLIKDDKTAVMDSVDRHFTKEWLENLNKELNGKNLDYLVIQHMEPDHSGSIADFMKTFSETKIVASAMAFNMMKCYFGTDYSDRRIVAGEGTKLELGKHVLNFITAPMVHWPEVLMTYDSTDKILFSADGFGKFGALDVEDEEGWACEARRYYFGIVGKFGMQVQAVLKKAATLQIEKICPLHGPVLSDNLKYYIDTYNTWSSYGVETEGVFIAYTSVYGHTKEAAELLAEDLKQKGCPKVAIADLAREDLAESVEDAFRYGKIVLATTTYCGEIFPIMRNFIEHLTERGYQKRKIAIIENGSWAPMAAKTIRSMFEKSKEITFAENTVSIKGAMTDANKEQLLALASEIC